MTLYPHIFFDSAWKASIIPFGDDTTFFAMKAFGGYDMRLAFALAVIGATAGQMFNWAAGRILIRYKDQLQVSEDWHARTTVLFNRYGIFLLLLSWAPLCNFFVALAGFVGARPRLVLPLVIAGEVFNYGQYLISA